MNHKTGFLAVAAAAILGSGATLGVQHLSSAATSAGIPVSPGKQVSLVDHGRYVMKISGCHDCHTPGFALTGHMDEKVALIGDSLGWQGPWGTTYPINLRLFMQSLTEEQWMQVARTSKARPPMPWMTLHAMSDRDLRSMYHYVRSLGPAGEQAPAYVPPAEQPKTPVVKFPGVES